MASFQESVEVPYGPVQAVQVVREALIESGLPITIKTTDPASGHIEGTVGVSAVSWSEEVSIDVAPGSKPGSSVVSVKSRSWQLIDWGKNRGNVETIVARIRGRP